ncbi:DUF6461 domain-containing protein [Actinomadura sp. NTSP31]|uniref:DUF6461 domain-containing protein n=1 Tax=Actinomadura sp. NTSP31 TaxID=1735447 RepID=UPI0035C229CE
MTLIETRDVDAVARAYGGRLNEARRGGLDELGDSFDEAGPQVAVRRVGDWVIAVEDNGHQGSRREVLRRLALDARAVNVYWYPDNPGRFAYAAGGRVLTAFESTWPERRSGADPDRFAEEIAGIPWDDPAIGCAANS